MSAPVVRFSWYHGVQTAGLRDILDRRNGTARTLPSTGAAHQFGICGTSHSHCMHPPKGPSGVYSDLAPLACGPWSRLMATDTAATPLALADTAFSAPMHGWKLRRNGAFIMICAVCGDAQWQSGQCADRFPACYGGVVLWMPLLCVHYQSLGSSLLRYHCRWRYRPPSMGRADACLQTGAVRPRVGTFHW
jgi:hypothetical protein